MPWALRASFLVIALATALGCGAIAHRPKGRSPLLPLAASPDMATLELYLAPVAVDDARLVTLWKEVDEHPLAADLRSRLRQNGLRVGVAGPQVSDALAGLLNVTDRPMSDEQRRLVCLDNESPTKLQVRQFQFRKRNELVVSSTYEQISLLRWRDGELAGKTYQKAEGHFDLRVLPESDGRIRIELRPELHYGDFKQQFSGGDGVFMLKPVRATQIFDELSIAVTLGPGQMLLLSCDCEKPGSIGHAFFNHPGGDKPMQKLWILRAPQAGPDRMFYEGHQEVEEPSSDTGA